MHVLKIIASTIGAILLIIGSTAVTIAALGVGGKPRRRGNEAKAWDEAIEDV